MFIFDYFISLPVLPILIVFSAVYKPSIGPSSSRSSSLLGGAP
jgi:ABC-type dipeptide/oligopeptide/nickel transport system permease subunit